MKNNVIKTENVSNRRDFIAKPYRRQAAALTSNSAFGFLRNRSSGNGKNLFLKDWITSRDLEAKTRIYQFSDANCRTINKQLM